jgi:uncharacterized membrane protein
VTFGFSQPQWLWLLLTIPWMVWLWHRSPSGLDPKRRWFSLILRLLITISVVLSLAGFEMRRPNDSVSAMFLFDHSDSIPERYRSAMINYFTEVTGKKEIRDKAGIIVFAGDASIETMPNEKVDAQKTYSVVKTHSTDIASSIRLAQAALPIDSQRRIILLSDGNENIGDALQEAESARANGITVDVLPVEEVKRGDVQVEKILIPSLVKKNEPFEAKVHLFSTDANPAKLRIFRNGRYLGEQDVSLNKGKNVYALPQSLEESGFHSYTIEVESPGDEVPQNNRGIAFTTIRGDPQALVIHADVKNASYLNQALSTSKIQINSRGLDGFPEDLAQLVNYDLIVLSNVNAGDLSEAQMKNLQTAVRDYGVGFVAIGGDDSFTAGSYRGTVLEEILPVSMDLSSKKVLPSGALALVVHATEFSDGNKWARDIALAALEALGPSDQMGIVLWDGTDRWLFPMQPVGDRQKLGKLISGMNPGDMPSFINVMQMAHEGLAGCKAHLKHMIVFSDGDPQSPTNQELDDIISDKITISTVMIGGHVAPDPMMHIAQRGGGRFHDVKAPENLPQIFIKEAAVILKASIFEEPFQPKFAQSSELMRGISQLPELQGYVATTPKPRAEIPLVTHNSDPLLAHWQYGLGRVAAFTSDAKPKWSTKWINWEQWNAFWGQTAKWALRRLEASSYETMLQVEDGKGRLIVDAVDSQGKFLNQLDLQAAISHPDGKNSEVKLRQTQPGHYEAEFQTAATGVYMANIKTMSNGVLTASQAVGTAIPYSAEFRDLKPNMHLLSKIADITGGRVLTPTDDLFNYKRIPALRPTPMWNWFLAGAILLFPLDVAIRRVMIDRAQWREWINKLLAKLGLDRSRVKQESDEAMSALLARKARLREEKKSSTIPEPTPFVRKPATPSQFVLPTPPVTPEKTEAKPTAETKPETPKPGGDYTSQLLAAKKRAQQKKPPQN